jgi:hypothetical protein
LEAALFLWSFPSSADFQSSPAAIVSPAGLLINQQRGRGAVFEIVRNHSARSRLASLQLNVLIFENRNAKKLKRRDFLGDCNASTRQKISR